MDFFQWIGIESTVEEMGDEMLNIILFTLSFMNLFYAKLLCSCCDILYILNGNSHFKSGLLLLCPPKPRTLWSPKDAFYSSDVYFKS